MLLQTNMNSINNCCDSTKRVETFYIHCDPFGQNEYARYENNIYTHPQTYKHINTDKQIHINILCVIQIRQCFLTLCLKVFKLFALFIESGKLFPIEGPI